MNRAGIRAVWWLLSRVALWVIGCFTLVGGWILITSLWLSPVMSGVVFCLLTLVVALGVLCYWAYRDAEFLEELRR